MMVMVMVTVGSCNFTGGAVCGFQSCGFVVAWL